MKSLTFDTLRRANKKRRAVSVYQTCEKDWIISDWMMALTGEVGELANILKKVRRGDFPLEEVISQVADELGDIQAYLDIVADELGLDLGGVTIVKFNKASRRINADVFIPLNKDSSK